MKYPYMYPPFSMKNFDNMSTTEAQQYFDWYTSEIPSRIQFLKQMIEGEFQLDFSSKSLIPLFTWYISNVHFYRLTEKEITTKLLTIDDNASKDNLLLNPIELLDEDYALAMDISIYYGEVLIHNLPQVSWTFYTKPHSFIHLNEPILDVSDDSGYLRKNPRTLLHTIIEQLKIGLSNPYVLYENYALDSADILGVDTEDLPY